MPKQNEKEQKDGLKETESKKNLFGGFFAGSSKKEENKVSPENKNKDIATKKEQEVMPKGSSLIDKMNAKKEKKAFFGSLFKRKKKVNQEETSKKSLKQKTDKNPFTSEVKKPSKPEKKGLLGSFFKAQKKEKKEDRKKTEQALPAKKVEKKAFFGSLFKRKKKVNQEETSKKSPKLEKRQEDEPKVLKPKKEEKKNKSPKNSFLTGLFKSKQEKSTDKLNKKEKAKDKTATDPKFVNKETEKKANNVAQTQKKKKNSFFSFFSDFSNQEKEIKKVNKLDAKATKEAQVDKANVVKVIEQEDVKKGAASEKTVKQKDQKDLKEEKPEIAKTPDSPKSLLSSLFQQSDKEKAEKKLDQTPQKKKDVDQDNKKNLFVDLFPQEAKKNKDDSLIETIVEQSEQTTSILGQKLKEKRDKLGKKEASTSIKEKKNDALFFSYIALTLSFAIPLVIYTYFFYQTTTESKLLDILNVQNIGMQHKEKEAERDALAKQVADTKKAILKLDETSKQALLEKTIQQIKDQTNDWLLVMDHIDEVTNQGVRYNDLLKRVVYDSFNFNGQENEITLNASVFDPNKQVFALATALIDAVNESVYFEGSENRNFSKSISDEGAEMSLTMNFKYMPENERENLTTVLEK